jgi:hypothetical protein
MIRVPNVFYRISPADRAPLRIGLLLDSRNEIPAFFATIVEDIKASNFARIELLVVRKTTGGTSTESNRQPHKPFLYDLYLRLDARMKPENDPLSPVDGMDLLAGIETIEVEPTGEDHRFPAHAAEKIRAKELDVLICLGFQRPSGDIFKSARYGVWSYEYGDNEFYRGAPPLFWELREQSPVSGVTLRVLSDEPGGGPVLAKSLFATEQTLSVSRNRYNPYWGSTELIIAKLNELHQFGWESVLERAIPATSYKGRREVYETPTNREMLPWLAPILLKKAFSYPFRKEMVQHWRIACRVNAKPLYESDAGSDFSGFRWIDAPHGHYWADPFVFEHEGKYWAFFEDYSYREMRAGLACAQISPQGELGPPTPCLHSPSCHYSYPHVFRAGSDIFMIPESYESNSVDLYRCTQFPNQWVHEALLLKGKFVDTTVWEHEGLWWVATTSADSGPAGALLLFYATSITGEWHFHPRNPISTDIRVNRGAGHIIRSQNRLIRPSQSCAPTYGYSFAFNEITELSKQRYSERPLKTITPEHWEGLSGVHTYNRAGNVELIDGRSPVPLKRVQISKR